MAEAIQLTDVRPGETIMDYLRENNVSFSFPCNGKGLCGKCKVKILAGGENIPLSSREKELLTPIDVKNHIRLACLCPAGNNMLISLSREREEIDTETRYADNTYIIEETHNNALGESAHLSMAVDLGSTTIVGALVSPSFKEPIAVESLANSTRRFGSDVLSRIDASNKGKRELLKRLLRSDIEKLKKNLIEPYLQKSDDLARDISMENCVISGNTTMEHIFSGFSCNGLGVYPYTPKDISLRMDDDFTMLPGISTFVGGDIVSGIFALSMDKQEEISLLIDLGTNGEMALGNKDKILVASVATGPAFEGGNISIGLPAVNGAVDSVKISGDEVAFTTINGEKEAKGICGSGVLELTAELLRNGIIDKTGLLKEKYFERGFPLTDSLFFTQRDIRQVQMAKSAIRSGIEVLIKEAGISVEDISKLYLAGGFSKSLNIEKAVEIGMLPPRLSQRAVPAFNTSLRGAVSFVLSGDNSVFNHILEISREILLSEQKYFTDCYIKYMDF